MSNSILVNNEPLLGLAAALKQYGTHPATGARWCNLGVRAKTGVRVRLEHVRVGSKLKTSAAALTRFFAALSADPDSPTPIAPPTATDRRKAAEAAIRELERAGA